MPTIHSSGQRYREHPTALEPLLGVRDVAKILAVSPRSINRIVARGELTPVWVGGVRRFEPSALAAFIADHRDDEKSGAE